jgi:acetylornithine/succinyldiaminopimelate/putrescine aminotransferase
VADLIQEYAKAGHKVRGAGLVVGSDIDPAKVASPHIRAHALEGRLFRTVLEDALRLCGVPCVVIVERTAYSQAAKILKRSEAELKREVASWGRSLDGPWRADEKTAALAAWLALAAEETDLP